MKYLILLLTILTAHAQSNVVSGNLSINYTSRAQSQGGVPDPGAYDRYQLNLRVCDGVIFQGVITNIPIIMGFTGPKQPAQIQYGLSCDVINPANLSQTKPIGQFSGVVPVSPTGVYDYTAGSLAFRIIGNSDSRVRGTAAGKPLVKGGSFLQKLRNEAMSLKKVVNGKAVQLTVTNYDRMAFQQVVFGAGPVKSYPDITVSGEMIYDYQRFAWHFTGLTIEYFVGGQKVRDTLTGNILWSESSSRIRDGLGQYDFDIRVNEKPPGENEVFAAADEGSFFAVDPTIPNLSGTMKYKDTFRDQTVVQSAVAISLKGNSLSRIQIMNITKLIILAIVPINAE